MKNPFMRSTFTVVIFVIALTALTATTAAAQQHDPITGQWDVVFSIQGQTAQGVLTLKLDGNKVTGTVNTAHTGPGTVNKGTWTDNKLSFTMDFAAHESIIVTGGFTDGVLQGDFATEGTTGTWKASRHPATATGSFY